jgi:hypothetical protein
MTKSVGDPSTQAVTPAPRIWLDQKGGTVQDAIGASGSVLSMELVTNGYSFRLKLIASADAPNERHKLVLDDPDALSHSIIVSPSFSFYSRYSDLWEGCQTRRSNLVQKNVFRLGRE